MSKKIIIGVLVLVAIIAALPLIGNQGLKSTIDDRLNALNEQGISVSADDTKSSYLNTSTHYEFQVNDKEKLRAFINTMSSQQIPPYLTASLDGVTIAADIRYSNIPTMSDIEVDIYPMRISKEVAASLMTSDAALADQVQTFIKDKKLFYHLNYAIASQKFDGYLQDVDETITFKDSSKIDFVISKAVFNGSGTLMEPTALDSSIKTVSANVFGNNGVQLNFALENIHSISDFTSKNSYVSDITLDTLNVKLLENSETSALRSKGVSIKMKSVDDGQKINASSDIIFDNFVLDTVGLQATLEKFVMKFSIEDVDSALFSTLQKVSEEAQSNPTQQSQQDVMMASGDLFSKGLTINVDEFSTDKLQYNGSKLMKGFKHNINIVVKPDNDFNQKLQAMPLALIQNFNVKAGLRFSKEFYSYVNSLAPTTAMASAYAKEDGDEIIFDIVVENGALSVNGKSL